MNRGTKPVLRFTYLVQLLFALTLSGLLSRTFIWTQSAPPLTHAAESTEETTAGFGGGGYPAALLLSHYIADRIAPKTQYVVVFVTYNNRRDTHHDGYVKIIAQYVVLIRYKLLHIVVV